jgi:hypothetical protein
VTVKKTAYDPGGSGSQRKRKTTPKIVSLAALGQALVAAGKACPRCGLRYKENETAQTHLCMAQRRFWDPVSRRIV